MCPSVITLASWLYFRQTRRDVSSERCDAVLREARAASAPLESSRVSSVDRQNKKPCSAYDEHLVQRKSCHLSGGQLGGKEALAKTSHSTNTIREIPSLSESRRAVQRKCIRKYHTMPIDVQQCAKQNSNIECNLKDKASETTDTGCSKDALFVDKSPRYSKQEIEVNSKMKYYTFPAPSMRIRPQRRDSRAPATLKFRSLSPQRRSVARSKPRDQIKRVFRELNHARSQNNQVVVKQKRSEQ